MRAATFLLLCISSASWAQSSQELRSRYGPPDQERFIVRPDVAAMVEYGTDTMACQMVIKAQQHLVRREDRFKSVEWETMKSLIDEMVPPNSRGTKINELDESMGCARSDISEYQNVTIELSTRCLTSGADTSTAITFKRAACPKPLTIQLLPTPVERKPQ